jgi:aspartate beta-hydroxylase
MSRFRLKNIEMNLGERIRKSVLLKYDNQQVHRVITCWNNFMDGKKLERHIDDDKRVFQSAECYIDGLTCRSFYDTTTFSWIEGLENNYLAVLKELISYERERRSLTNESDNGFDKNALQVIKPTGTGEQGDGEWLGPRDKSGSHYGPEWKTLGLQDRSVWNEELIAKFPFTINLLISQNVPSCEVFFAKQGPRSGLKPHSDNNNFIMTCHLALDVPEGECWIKVGDTTHYWKNGRTCVFDTSVIHSTENVSDRTRYVLLIRFWHPELSAVEIDALK